MASFFRNARLFASAVRFAYCASALAAIFCVQPASAQGTRLWTQSHLEDFEKGTPQGVAIGSDGSLRQAPIASDVLITPSTYVWSVAVDKSGTAYLGTASPASVLRVGTGHDAKAFTLFESKEVSVQVVRIGPDGALYAATLPGGKVYRLKADGNAALNDTTATVIFDAGKLKGDKQAHSIWDLSFDAAGRLYIATGGPGAVYRVDPGKPESKPELFFQSDEQHIRTLAWDHEGNLIAGSDGSGLVYRIDPAGKGYVLFEAPRREITAIAIGTDGTIYAASVGDKSRNPLPPLPVQGVGSVSFNIMQPGSMQAANNSASVPEGTEIYALAKNQAPRKLWSGKDEIVYALAAEADGLIALSGNRGRVFRINADGSYADIAHLEAQQALSMANTPGKDLLVGTGNTGRLFCLGDGEKHEFASDVLDAGALARFGRVEVQPGSKNFEIWTRSGNVEQPVRGWSEWKELKDGAIASPAGRFLQWKAILRADAKLGGVAVNYLPVNAAPVVDEVVVVPGARLNPQGQSGQPAIVTISFGSTANPGYNQPSENTQPIQALKDRGAVTVRWAAHDDNGDDLIYSLFLRGDGETVWRPLKDGLTEKAYSFDAAQIPDGGYQIKVVASDAPSHSPGEALTGSKESERFEVDTTPPVVTGLHVADGHIVFAAEDAASAIVHAEYSLDAGPWQYIEPVGGLSDGRHEHYDVRLPALDKSSGEHLLTVRVYDRHDNVGLAKTVF